MKLVGRKQSSFTAAALDPALHERTELKYYARGLKRAENVVVTPQGAVRQRAGFRDLGVLAADAGRLVPFQASDGSLYTIVMAPLTAEIWGAAGLLATLVTPYGSAALPELNFSQYRDGLVIFHPNHAPRELRHLGPTTWEMVTVGWQNMPIFDYGEVYTNGVSAIWKLQFEGFLVDTVYRLDVNGEKTISMKMRDAPSARATQINNALLNLPNVEPGIVVTSTGTISLNEDIEVTVEFAGADNLISEFSLSGEAINKADAAVVAFRTRVGKKPGEPIMSASRGWPRCGAFFQQRMLIGGLRSLPNAWLASRTGDPFNLDTEDKSAAGAMVVPMDIPGGEAIERIAVGRNLMIFTTDAEYHIPDRTLAKGTPPNHVKSSTNGIARAVPVVESEGAVIYAHRDAAVLSEFRYNEVDGTFVSSSISLLAAHLMVDVRDMAVRRAASSDEGNLIYAVQAGGNVVLGTLLREQEVTAFTDCAPAADILAVACLPDRQVHVISRFGAGDRRLARFETGLLLDEAQDFSFGSPTAVLTGLSRFNGRQVWALADGNVYGPFTIADASLTLPIAALAVTVGSWVPPLIEILPPSRDNGQGASVSGKGRLHSVVINVNDTTSLAIAVNGGPLRDVDLQRYGLEPGPELSRGYSGVLTLTGLRGFADQPTLIVSQLRPGRLEVRSIQPIYDM